MMVLETEDHCRARGGTPLGEVMGFATANDAFHQTAPHPRGVGAVRAMRMAVFDADVDFTSVGYVNAHATSTVLGDAIETRAIQEVFGGGIAVSSTKGATGHLLGAAGAAEAVFTLMALSKGEIPPTANLQQVGEDCDQSLHYVQDEPMPWRVGRNALSNSFGFGGCNASLLLGAAPF